MFTGLVTAVGTLAEARRDGEVARVAVLAPAGFAQGLEPGGSVAVDGVCMTLVQAETGGGGDRMAFDLVPETLRRSNMGWRLDGGEGLGGRYPVNLERCLRMGDELGGHIVSGHVACTATAIDLRPLDGGACDLTLELQEEDAAPVFPKGFVAVNGVSLTLGEVQRPPRDMAKDAAKGVARVALHLIPETLQRTNLGAVCEGDRLNIEHDAMTVAVVQRMQQLGLQPPG